MAEAEGCQDTNRGETQELTGSTPEERAGDGPMETGASAPVPGGEKDLEAAATENRPT